MSERFQAGDRVLCILTGSGVFEGKEYTVTGDKQERSGGYRIVYVVGDSSVTTHRAYARRFRLVDVFEGNV